MARFILLLLLVVIGNLVLYGARVLAKNKDMRPTPSAEPSKSLKYFDVPEARIVSPLRNVTGHLIAEATEHRQQSPKSGKRMTRTSSYPHDWMDPPISEKPQLNGIQQY